MNLDWIETEKELPQEDGTYEICNHPEMTATAYYDGYGFQYLGIYRIPKYWKDYKILEKKYGKQ